MREKYFKKFLFCTTCLLSINLSLDVVANEVNNSTIQQPSQAQSDSELVTSEPFIDTESMDDETISFSLINPRTSETTVAEANADTSITSPALPASSSGASQPSNQLATTSEEETAVFSTEDTLFRLYNPNLRVHLYTKDTNEYHVLAQRGWRQEGEAWKVLSSQGEVVYRLYQPDLRVHLYTKDANEYAVLATRGWKQEGEAFRSYGDIPIYRLYHSGLRVHLYTSDANEYRVLKQRGWRQEGIAFYGIGGTTKLSQKIEKATGTISIQNRNTSSGTFDVVISDVASPVGVTSVLVPVWSEENGQDDLVWYEAQRQGDGSYKVTVQAKTHGYSTGKYQIHLYLVQSDGTKVGIPSSVTTTVEITDTLPRANMSIENSDQTYGFFDIRISELYVPSGMDKIEVAVWSEVNGQNDLKRYSAIKQNDGSYRVSVRASNHQYEQGTYRATLFIFSKNKEYMITQTSTSISYIKTEIPRFIDVSSHNGSLSVADYQILATNGISGVVVKLSEGVSYINPYAEMQIKNAIAAGLKVSVYHYSHFTSKDEAREEARYFVGVARKLGLSESTVMVNDIEEPATRSNINEHMEAWETEMRRLGYSNLIHYTSASWLDVNDVGVIGPIQTGRFGFENFWVAQYPYDTMTITQAMTMSMHSRAAAWQFTSKGRLLTGRPYFDINLDYKNRFTK